MRANFQTIVCTTDLSDYANHAIPYGISFAREFGARLYICHVIHVPSVPVYGEQLQEKVRNQIEKVMDGAHVEWELRISQGSAIDEIPRLVKETGADLTIAAAHGVSGWKRMVLGSVTEHLVRSLSCPLLVVRRPEHEFISPMRQKIKLKKVLVGCDFSESSNLAFEYGLSLAQEFQAELHLLLVEEAPLYRFFPGKKLPPEGATPEEVRRRLREKLIRMVPEEASSWCTVYTEIVEGEPYREIISYAAQKDIDLIVLGVRGHSLVESLLVGCTTDRAVRQASCPVLTVPVPAGT